LPLSGRRIHNLERYILVGFPSIDDEAQRLGSDQGAVYPPVPPPSCRRSLRIALWMISLEPGFKSTPPQGTTKADLFAPA